MKQKKKKNKGVNLQDVVKAVQKAGAKVSFNLEPRKMPARLPGDPAPVTLLLDESERVAVLANRWLDADVPNQLAAQKAFEMAWAYALAGAYLRARLFGEVGPEAMKNG